MILSAIAAMSMNRVIGKDGGLPWRIPEDFQFFKTKTTGHIMIMGRKTFESFPKPLPNRLHVVITRQKNYKKEGAEVFQTVDAAVQFCKDLTIKEKAKWGDEVFIIGGGEIYREMLSVTDRIYLTEIHQNFEGDALFPDFSTKEFVEVERKKRTDPVAFDFVTYEKRNKMG